MSTFSIRVLFRCFAVQMYCPESSAATLKMDKVPTPLSSCRSLTVSFCGSVRVPLCRLVSVPFCRLVSVPFCMFLSEHLVHVMADGGKLSTLQVRFRVSPSFTLAFPVILTFFTSVRQNYVITVTAPLNCPCKNTLDIVNVNTVQKMKG